MPRDMLRTGLAWLTTKLNEHAAREVEYVRGASSTTLRATFGTKLLKLDDGDGGISMQWTDLDLLVPAASLVLDGEAIEPTRRDLVRVPEEGGVTLVYEVGSVPGEPEWTWADPHRSMVRIHCRFVEVEGPYA